MDKLNGKSMDLESKNIEELKKIFPSVVAEGKIDFDKLRLLLGEEVDDSMEKYQFLWKGKNKAIKLAQTPSTATLRPDKGNSKNWETTENLYIEGDNLEVLKQLQKTYFGKIKMIYIDPPYNTGGDFVYKDDFKDSIENYKKQTHQASSSNPETSGRYHTDWLNMMYPRLVLAKNLLTEDGLICLSIDENEKDNLKKLADEIFGEFNFRNTLLVRRRVKSLNLQFAEQGLFSYNVGTEYVLMYAKSEKTLFNDLRQKKKNIPEKGSWNVFWSNADRPTMRYELLGFTPKTGQWRWSKELAMNAVENYRIYEDKFSDKISLEDYWKSTNQELRFIRKIENGVGKNGGVQYWVGPRDTSLRTSNWTDIEVSQIHKEFDLPFDNPKNIDLILEILKIQKSNNDIILDFFSGSATTAHAVMQLNAEDGGNRKFIMVQLPEKTDEKSEAYKTGYKNICEIGKERIRRAGEKIKKELIQKKQNSGFLDENIIDPNQLDIGFKVFKLDDTNIKPWDSSLEVDEKTLLSQIEVIKENRTKEDVLYEILLKYGVFNEHVNVLSMNGQTIYSIAENYMIVNLNERISSDDIKSIAQLKPSVVVFLENGFADDNQKINAEATLKHQGIEDVKCI